MIKKVFHKAISSLLAVLVLLSTFSFAIEKHFCGEALVDVSVFHEHKKCGMDSDEGFQKKSCCKDEIVIVQGQDDLKVSAFEDFSFGQQLFVCSFVYTYISLFESLEKHVIPHKDYSPPNLVKDINVLDQVFII